MKGPPPKPPERSQRRKRRGLELIVTGARAAPEASRAGDVPEPPAHWLSVTKREWRVFWESRLAVAVEAATDLPAVRRLFSLRDEQERAYRGYRKARLVLGAQDRIVINPLGRIMKQLEPEIRQLEDRFGLSPRARLGLGVTATHYRRSLEDLNSELNERGIQDEEDPRRVGAAPPSPRRRRATRSEPSSDEA